MTRIPSGRTVLRATAYTMVGSAAFHLIAAAVMSIGKGTPDYFNMFNVIGLSWFIPQLSTGVVNAVLGTLLVVGIGTAVSFILDARQHKH